MTLRKTYGHILLTAAALAFLCTASFAAEEKWRTVKWESTSSFIAAFDALCLESGLTSFDVLETNGYIGSGKRPPVTGAELLIPLSKGDLLGTWMEVQKRNGGARPLVTIKPHYIPGITAGADQAEAQPAADVPEPEEPKQAEEKQKEPPAPASGQEPDKPEDEAEPDSFKNMRIVVSGDEIVLQGQGGKSRERILSLIRNPELVSQDVIIPDPPVLKPMVGRPPATQGKMMWPVSGKVSSAFGGRGRRNHDGIDMPMPEGTPIAAALDGVVADTGTNRDMKYRGYGTTVVIDHGNGIVTMYAHCSKLNVKKGQRVRQGEIVGFVGNTGRTTTHHVHFEVRKNGAAVNPIPYLAPR